MIIYPVARIDAIKINTRKGGLVNLENQTIQQELIQLSNQWMEAIQQKNMAFLEQILAPEYVLISIRGRSERSEWMRVVPVYNIRSFQYQDFDIRLYNDVAVVNSKCIQQASVAGAGDLSFTKSEDLSYIFMLTDIWNKRDGRWQVVTRHSSRLGPAASK
jgi:hypothetical protein